jgi:hypothetical protein
MPRERTLNELIAKRFAELNTNERCAKRIDQITQNELEGTAKTWGEAKLFCVMQRKLSGKTKWRLKTNGVVAKRIRGREYAH